MGNGFVERSDNHDGFGANDVRALLSKPSELTYTRAVNDTINYVRAVFPWPNGPGSNKWQGRRFQELRRYVDRRFFDLCKCHLEAWDGYSDGLLHEDWQLFRQHGYKILKQRLLLVAEHMPLFDGIVPQAGCVVYAYTCKNPHFEHRLIKLGYTASDLHKYIAGKRLLEDAILLAETPGDKELEGQYLDRWVGLLATGRERFHPDRMLVDWIRQTYDTIEPDFNKHVEAAVIAYSKRSDHEDQP